MLRGHKNQLPTAISQRKKIIIKDTHRGLWYEDGVPKRIFGAGRCELPRGPESGVFGRRHPRAEVVVIDVRERELTIKGEEILTSDATVRRYCLKRALNPKFKKLKR